jgi:hypothetical protein
MPTPAPFGYIKVQPLKPLASAGGSQALFGVQLGTRASIVTNSTVKGCEFTPCVLAATEITSPPVNSPSGRR